MSYDLVGIGNALVDIEVQVDDAFIEQASVTKGGMTLSSIEDQKKDSGISRIQTEKNFFWRFCCKYRAWCKCAWNKILLPG